MNKLTLVEFLTKWQAYMIVHPEQRKGQALLNLLHMLDRDDLYARIDERFGIFYNDKQINDVIGYLATELD